MTERFDTIVVDEAQDFAPEWLDLLERLLDPDGANRLLLVADAKQIVQLGRADVGTIAAMFPQDRSVVARHLQVLERAGILKSHVDGRHTFYELNGQGVLKQLEGLVELFRALSPLCCPT